MLCLVAVATVGFTASVVIAAVDPDWIGTVPTNISQSQERKALHPAVAAGASGQVIVAWNDIPSEYSESDIYVTHSDDHGKSWYAPERLSDTDARSQLPDVLIAEGRGFIAWTERQGSGKDATFTIHEAELGGKSRSVPIPKADTPSDIPTRPRLAAGPNRLHIVFNAGFEYESQGSHIFHSSRALADTTWSPATQIQDASNGNISWFPVLAVSPDGEDLHVVWEEKPLMKDGSVRYMHGTANGPDVSWMSPRTLSVDINSVKPDIAISSSGEVHVIWGEVVPAPEGSQYYVGYRRYDHNSRSWSPAKRIDPVPVYVNEAIPTQSPPRLALREGGDGVDLCVAWHGCRVAGQCAEDALVSCSWNGGETWESPRTMSTLPPGVYFEVDISIWPSVTFDESGTLHGVWRQRVATNSQEDDYEIYYAHALHTVLLPLVTRNR